MLLFSPDCLCSLSEPSLLNPNETILFSSNHHPDVLQKHSSVPPISKSSVPLSCKISPPPRPTSQLQKHQSHQEVQSCNRPGFINFCQAIQLNSKPRPVNRHLHNPILTTERSKLKPAVIQYHKSPFKVEPLSITGKPCFFSCSQRSVVSAAAVPARSQLHVFLPTEVEGEEADSESADEGFMDELDCRGQRRQ